MPPVRCTHYVVVASIIPSRLGERDPAHPAMRNGNGSVVTGGCCATRPGYPPSRRALPHRSRLAQHNAVAQTAITRSARPPAT